MCFNEIITYLSWSGICMPCGISNQVLAELSLEWEAEVRTRHSNSKKIEMNYTITYKDISTN